MGSKATGLSPIKIKENSNGDSPSSEYKDAKMKNLPKQKMEEIVTREMVRGLLELIDRSRPKEDGCLSERDGSEFFARSGLSYPDSEASIMVICDTVSETYYYRSGLFYRTSRAAFYRLVRGIEPIGGEYALSSSKKLRLHPIEAEFVLGILSAIDPLSAWGVFGNDLRQFAVKSRKNLNKWSVELASLILTQQMLKKYARRLYQKIYLVLSDGAWATLPDSTATDDAVIARFAGLLLGTYHSEELMDKMIHAHWAISFQILKRFSAVARHQLRTQMGAGWQRNQIEILGRSLQKLGVKVTGNDVLSYLAEIKIAADKVERIVQMLSNAPGW